MYQSLPSVFQLTVADIAVYDIVTYTQKRFHEDFDDGYPVRALRSKVEANDNLKNYLDRQTF